VTATAVDSDARTVGAERGRPAHLPGELSMWVFVLGDLAIFGIYFIIFMFSRLQQHDVFLASQRHLSQGLGALNTLLLLTSSRLVARAVLAARGGEHERAARLTLGGGACGVAFIAVKALEWSAKIRQGYTLPVNDFFAYYYVLTGVHVLHVVLGLIILGIVVRELRTPSLRRLSIVESGAIFWHLVDLLWIVIFVLLYVMR
jgi:nitric oxide reductase NorE protein